MGSIKKKKLVLYIKENFIFNETLLVLHSINFRPI